MMAIVFCLAVQRYQRLASRSHKNTVPIVVVGRKALVSMDIPPFLQRRLATIYLHTGLYLTIDVLLIHELRITTELFRKQTVCPTHVLVQLIYQDGGYVGVIHDATYSLRDVLGQKRRPTRGHYHLIIQTEFIQPCLGAFGVIRRALKLQNPASTRCFCTCA